MAGRFITVECPDCENEQTIFEKASTEIACAVCGHTLARPTGGLVDLDADVTEVVEAR